MAPLQFDDYSDPIEFLVRRKFTAGPQVLARLGGVGAAPATQYGYRTGQTWQYSKEAEAYRQQLRAMPADELEALYASEGLKQYQENIAKAEAEEAKRFFNLPHAGADVGHWSKAAYWSLEEAVALSLGKEPQYVDWNKLEKFRSVSAFVEKYRKLRDLALRARAMEQLSDPVFPPFYIAWTKRNGIEFNEGLAKAVEANAGALTDWKQNYEKLSELYETHKAEWEEVAAGWREAAENAN